MRPTEIAGVGRAWAIWRKEGSMEPKQTSAEHAEHAQANDQVGAWTCSLAGGCVCVPPLCFLATRLVAIASAGVACGGRSCLWWPWWIDMRELDVCLRTPSLHSCSLCFSERGPTACVICLCCKVFMGTLRGADKSFHK